MQAHLITQQEIYDKEVEKQEAQRKRDAQLKKSKEQKATELLASMDKDALAAMLDSMGIKVK